MAVFSQSVAAVEDPLQRIAEGLRLVAELCDDAVFLLRLAPEPTLEYANAAIQSLTGYDPSECQAQFLLTEDWRWSSEASDVGTSVVKWPHKAGHRVGVAIRWKRWRDADGNVFALQGIAWDVTSQLRERERLRLLSSAVESSGDGVIIANAREEIEYVNPAFERITGYAAAELRACTPGVFRSRASPAVSYADLCGHAERARPRRAVFRDQRKNGEAFFLEKTVTPITDEAGAVTHYVVTCRDVTASVQQENERQRSDERFKRLLELSADVLTVLDDQGNVVFQSPSAARLCGRLVDDERTQNPLKSIHPDDLENAQLNLAKLTAPQAEVRATYRYLHGDGSVRFFETVGQNLLDDPLVRGIVTNTRDITEETLAHSALRSSEQQYRALFEQHPLPMFIYDDETLCFAAANAAASVYYGYSREEFLAMEATRLQLPEGLPALREYLSRREGSSALSGPWRHVKRDGSIISVMIASQLITFAGRSARLVTIIDVTERLNAEEALRRSERSIRTILEAIPQSVAVNLGGRHVYVNQAFAELTGYSREEMLNLPMERFSPPEHRLLAKERLERALRGEELRPREGKVPRKDGKLVDVEVSGVRIELDGQAALLVFVRDLTEQKQLQARLALSDRMASVGTLAAGVAHEINNPLSFVTMNLEFLGRELELVARSEAVKPADLKDLFQALRDARVGSDRVRQIVRDLKTFSRPDEETRGPVDVARVIESSLNIAWNEIRHRARLVKDFQPVPLILANEGRLAQVFLNLLINAAQSMRDGEAANNELRISLRPGMDGGVMLTVADTGVGIPPQVLPRIFDPFFTTKPIGSGTGLGLSICHGIITSLGGTIHVTSEPGRGTTVVVEVPPGRGNAQTAPEVLFSKNSPLRARILVVDDEEAVGTSLQRILRQVHQVTFVTSARRALELISLGQRFDLILCDVMMPDLTGRDLLRELEANAADQARRMVFMTGGAFTPEADEFFRERTAWRLEKPFGMAEVERVVTEALAALGAGTTGVEVA